MLEKLWIQKTFKSAEDEFNNSNKKKEITLCENYVINEFKIKFTTEIKEYGRSTSMYVPLDSNIACSKFNDHSELLFRNKKYILSHDFKYIIEIDRDFGHQIGYRDFGHKISYINFKNLNN